MSKTVYRRLDTVTYTLDEPAAIMRSLDEYGVALVQGWTDPLIVGALVEQFKATVSYLPQFDPTAEWCTELEYDGPDMQYPVGRFCPAPHGCIPTASSYHNTFGRSIRKIVAEEVLAPALAEADHSPFPDPGIRILVAPLVVGGGGSDLRKGRWVRRQKAETVGRRRYVGFVAMAPDQIGVAPCSHRAFVNPESVDRRTGYYVEVPAGTVALWDDRLVVRESQVRPWRVNLEYDICERVGINDVSHTGRLLTDMAAPPPENRYVKRQLVPGLVSSLANAALVKWWKEHALTAETRRFVDSVVQDRYSGNSPFPPLSVLFPNLLASPYAPYSPDERRLYLEHVSAVELALQAFSKE